MIVLVNDRQKEALKAAENKSDRFNRTTEDNQLPTPTNPNPSIPNVIGVPEPSEFLLLAIVGSGLLFTQYRLRWHGNKDT